MDTMTCTVKVVKMLKNDANNGLEYSFSSTINACTG